MSLRTIAARIADMEKSLTAVPKVVRKIARALRTKLLPETEQRPEAASAEPGRAEASTSPATRVDAPNRNAGALPETYGRNRLVMLVVDPNQVHTYWEVTPQKLAEAREVVGAAGSRPAVLRFYDAASAGAQGSTADPFDVAVDLQSRNWYVHLWSPDRSYYAELGLKSDTGQFFPLAKSNIVRTPRAWPVMHVEEHFMRVDSVEQRAEPVSPPAFVRPHRDRSFASSDQSFMSRNRPAAQVPFGTTSNSQVHSPTRINSEEIMKRKLADLFAVRLEPRRGSPVQEVLPAQDADPNLTALADPNLTALAEKHFVTGIFSRAPKKTTGKA